MRHFLTLRDFSKEEIEKILDLAASLKKNPQEKLKGKSLAMIFEKNSTRTRMAFELAAAKLGMHRLFLSSKDIQISRGEPIKDTARVIGSMVDFVMMRVNSHSTLSEFAKFSKASVINGLSELYHPTQVLGDLLTMREFNKNDKVAFIGDTNNMCNSWLIASAILGLEMSVAIPKTYKINDEILDFVKQTAMKSGAKINITNDKLKAMQDKNVIITDTWISMGEEALKEQKLKDFDGFIVDESAFRVANKDAILLHCLPAYRGYEVSETLFEKHEKVIFTEAINREFVVAALLCFLDDENNKLKN